MVAEMWAEHNRIEEERKLQLELDLWKMLLNSHSKSN
jgi:hypothetical protein